MSKIKRLCLLSLCLLCPPGVLYSVFGFPISEHPDELFQQFKKRRQHLFDRVWNGECQCRIELQRFCSILFKRDSGEKTFFGSERLNFVQRQDKHSVLSGPVCRVFSTFESLVYDMALIKGSVCRTDMYLGGEWGDPSARFLRLGFSAAVLEFCIDFTAQLRMLQCPVADPMRNLMHRDHDKAVKNLNDINNRLHLLKEISDIVISMAMDREFSTESRNVIVVDDDMKRRAITSLWGVAAHMIFAGIHSAYNGPFIKQEPWLWNDIRLHEIFDFYVSDHDVFSRNNSFSRTVALRSAWVELDWRAIREVRRMVCSFLKLDKVRNLVFRGSELRGAFDSGGIEAFNRKMLGLVNETIRPLLTEYVGWWFGLPEGLVHKDFSDVTIEQFLDPDRPAPMDRAFSI